MPPSEKEEEEAHYTLPALRAERLINAALRERIRLLERVAAAEARLHGARRARARRHRRNMRCAPPQLLVTTESDDDNGNNNDNDDEAAAAAAAAAAATVEEEEVGQTLTPDHPSSHHGVYTFENKMRFLHFLRDTPAYATLLLSCQRLVQLFHTHIQTGYGERIAYGFMISIMRGMANVVLGATLLPPDDKEELLVLVPQEGTKRRRRVPAPHPMALLRLSCSGAHIEAFLKCSRKVLRQRLSPKQEDEEEDEKDDDDDEDEALSTTLKRQCWRSDLDGLMRSQHALEEQCRRL
jgi:hypothetical protein